MSSNNIISGAELARCIMSTVGAGYMLVGTFISATNGLDKLDETRLYQTLENWPALTSDSEYLVAKGAEQSQTQVDGDALFGFVTFDASSRMRILESKGCSGVIDNGSHEMSVSFEKPMGEYIYSFFASEAIDIVTATQESNSLGLTFNKQYTGTIKIVFFEKLLGFEID